MQSTTLWHLRAPMQPGRKQERENALPIKRLMATWRRSSVQDVLVHVFIDEIVPTKTKRLLVSDGYTLMNKSILFLPIYNPLNTTLLFEFDNIGN